MKFICIADSNVRGSQDVHEPISHAQTRPNKNWSKLNNKIFEN